MPRLVLALDVGGTFTDVVVADRAGRVFHVAKTASTPANRAEGFFAGIAAALALAGAGPGDVEAVLHGSTVATNAILERKGARTALVTTEGFRDVLEIGRGEIPREADLYARVKPRHPIRPRDVVEVPERMCKDGSVARPLDRDSVRALAPRLAGYEAVAVCPLHAWANPAHEAAVAEILTEALPGVALSLFSEVLPVFREYERAMATVLNAGVRPPLARAAPGPR